MTIGEFWGHVTTLCHVYDGRVTSGPRSIYWNNELGGVPTSFHLLGLGADVVLRYSPDRQAFTEAAARLKITVIDEIEKKNHLHLQPK